MTEQAYVDLPLTPTEAAIVGALALMMIDNITKPPPQWREAIDRLNRYVVKTWPTVVDDLTDIANGTLG